MRTLLLLIAVAFGLTACIRSSTTQLAPDRAMISARGGASYDLADIQKRMIEDAAKLTVQSGYDYFTIVDATGGYATAYITTPGYTQTQTNFNAYTTPNAVYGTANTMGYSSPTVTNQVQKPRGSITIRMFRGTAPRDDPNSFDAHAILQFSGQ